jgi:hypothetical protein
MVNLFSNNLFDIPYEATDEQREIFNKNKELLILAYQNRNRYGVIMSLVAGIGSQDLVFLDKTRFINEYPYSCMWYQLAYGMVFVS